MTQTVAGTPEEGRHEQALTGYRVLDLTNEYGWMCGKVLADLGADVIKIEPLGGDPGRQRSPFYQDETEAEESPSWWAYNTSKRSLCVDLARPQGRELCLEMVPVAHPALEATFEYPGAFARFSRTPCLPPRRAPLLGEHSRQFLHEFLGLDPPTIAALEADGVIVCQPHPAAASAVPMGLGRQSISSPVSPPLVSSPLPLTGVRVIDFTWVAAGPLTAKYLGDHGAEVIRVESWAHPDSSRYAPPTMGGELDYARLTHVKPDLIMLSTCIQGQTGPHAPAPGFGNLMAGLLGFYELTGWPDGEPCVVYGAYTDVIVPRFAAVAILAALEYRRRTGQGQHIDLAQSEACLHVLTPALLDYTVNGRIMRRQGNGDAHMAPHGAYPCQGERWPISPALLAQGLASIMPMFSATFSGSRQRPDAVLSRQRSSISEVLHGDNIV